MLSNTTTSKGKMINDLEFTLVYFTCLIHTSDNRDDDDEPQIQATKSQMVYYVVDKLDKN